MSLSSSVIENLSKIEGTALGYVYCLYQEPGTQNAKAFLGAIARQLLFSYPSLSYVVKGYCNRERQDSTPRIELLVKSDN